MTQTPNNHDIQQHLRHILHQHGHVADAGDIALRQDLYAAGLTSFAAVQVMLAIENSFHVSFPKRMLNRRCFSSLEAIAGCVFEISDHQVAA